MRLLFVSPTELSRPLGGRAMLAKLHHDVLSELIGDGFAAYRLSGHATSDVIHRIAGFIDGVTEASIADASTAIDRHGAEAVWLDGSNLGRLAEALRRARPELRILTFCHNVEARFFLGALRRRLHPKKLGVLIGNYISERLALRHSDDIVALSARDSFGLYRLYGRAADHILPMAVADRLLSPPTPKELVAVDAPLLFVGGAFYANQTGIAWFARKVAPLIDLRVEVIGHGMDKMRDELASASAVSVIGPVDELEPHYRLARAAIAPIFDGSGMKTKVAEALMFGKRVIGTAEAFSGYETVASRAGWQCETPEAFARAIDEAQQMAMPALDPGLRALYERYYSTNAVKRQLRQVFDLTARG